MQAPQWHEIIRPGTVNLIVGYKGRGKSALGYYLLETTAPLYDLQPMVVNFPEEKKVLLPPGYLLADLEDALSTESVVALVDEGTTQLPAGNKLEDFIKGCSSLSRQRGQIFIFIFHTTRDIGSRILRGIDTVMIKEPSRRQIQQGAKDKWLLKLLEDAKAQIEAKGGDPCRWTYVDSEDPDFSGLMSNPLPSFWSQDLSTAWKGVPILDRGTKPKGLDINNLSLQDARRILGLPPIIPTDRVTRRERSTGQ